jgi:hypothetical protein
MLYIVALPFNRFWVLADSLTTTTTEGSWVGHHLVAIDWKFYKREQAKRLNSAIKIIGGHVIMANKYWETETPEVMQTEKNQLRFYPENGKVQVFPVVASAANGVGRGATIDLASMTADELEELKSRIEHAIQSQLTTEEASA